MSLLSVLHPTSKFCKVLIQLNISRFGEAGLSRFSVFLEEVRDDFYGESHMILGTGGRVCQVADFSGFKWAAQTVVEVTGLKQEKP